MKRFLALVLLSWLAIELHEMGHFLFYLLAGYRAQISLQQTTPLGSVPMNVEHAALLAGPAVSALAAVIFLLVARSRPGFGWAMAALTNASLRLFPLTMDLLRAIQDGHPFSDEGTVAAMVASSQIMRVCLVAVPLVLFLGLTVLAGRMFRFRHFAFWKVLGLYAATLAIGIGVVIVDELTHKSIVLWRSACEMGISDRPT
jgi:hypothetical protein